MDSKEVGKILDHLERMYPTAKCELNYQTPFQLLIATMLSAQTTDKMVNKVTETLFLKYPRPQDFFSLTNQALEQEIREIGLYRNKAKNILKTCEILIEHYGGALPNDFINLTSLPGVGRKTANVVLNNAFGVPVIAVDTHVYRVSKRIGLADRNTPLGVEEDLMKQIPQSRLGKTHHLLIWHGRRICRARKPICQECDLKNVCKFFQKQQSVLG